MSIKVKSVLEGNIFRKSQVELLIDGLETAGIITTSIADITGEMDVITLPDNTQVPTGIDKPGEFEVEIQLAHRESLNALLTWAYQARDRSTNGVSPEYKRNGTIIYHRLFSGGGQTAAGRALANERFRVTGLWVKSYNAPGGEMDSTEDAVMQLTLCYDSITPMDKGLGL